MHGFLFKFSPYILMLHNEPLLQKDYFIITSHIEHRSSQKDLKHINLYQTLNPMWNLSIVQGPK